MGVRILDQLWRNCVNNIGKENIHGRNRDASDNLVRRGSSVVNDVQPWPTRVQWQPRVDIDHGLQIHMFKLLIELKMLPSFRKQAQKLHSNINGAALAHL